MTDPNNVDANVNLDDGNVAVNIAVNVDDNNITQNQCSSSSNLDKKQGAEGSCKPQQGIVEYDHAALSHEVSDV